MRLFVGRGIPKRVANGLSSDKTSSVFRDYDILSLDDLQDAARKHPRRRREQDADRRLKCGWRYFCKGCWTRAVEGGTCSFSRIYTTMLP